MTLSSTSSTPLLLRAPAKINLGLEVLRRRSDGYHDINTIFATVDLCDEIELSLRRDSQILCRVEGAPTLESDERNLCVGALGHLQRLIGNDAPGFDILLRKNIPIGGGLGGGSSDAAAVLLGAAELLGDSAINPSILAEIAATLGSDVPFFLSGGVATATSRGEVLHPLAIELPWHVLLVNPGIHVATSWAYAAVGRTTERPASDLERILRAGVDHPERLRREMVNDFEKGVFEAHPLLGKIKEALYEAGADLALMSGSGATVFGLFRDKGDGEAAARRLGLWWRMAGIVGAGPRARP